VRRYRILVNDEEMPVSVEEAEGGLLVSVAGRIQRVDVAEVVPGWYSLVLDGRSYDLGVRGRGGRWTIVLEGETYVVQVGGALSAGPAAPHARARRTGEVRAPMPGLVLEVRAAEGAEVAPEQPLIIMEAMKMQMEIRAPRAGVIRRVHVASGQEVPEGQALVTLE
jgi:pyruvate carboxylase subunit B